MKHLRIRDQTLFFLGSIGVLLGIFLTNVFRENIVFILAFVCIASIQILFFFRSVLWYIPVCIFFSCLGGYMSLERLHEIDGTTALFERETAFFTRNTTIKGTIAEKVSENDKNARYILREITVGTRSFPHKTGILVAFPDGRNKKIDDIIVFTGMLRLPASNERFDYRTYLLLDDVYATTTASFPEITGTTHSPVPMVLIRRIHDRLLGIIEYIYP